MNFLSVFCFPAAWTCPPPGEGTVCWCWHQSPCEGWWPRSTNLRYDFWAVSDVG